MRIERTKNSVRSTASGMLNRCINLLLPFVIRTVIIHRLGTEFLGLNSLFTSVIQVLNLAELGMGNALIFSMYKPVAEDDYATLHALLRLYKRIYRIIGFVILGIGICLIPLLPILVDTKQLVGTNIDIHILYLIYLFNTVVSYLFFAYRKSLLMAYQRQDVISNLNSVFHFLLYTLQIGVLVIKPNYYAYIILMPLFTTAENLAAAIISKRWYKQILTTPPRAGVEAGNIQHGVKYIVGHKIGAVVIQSADSIVISSFLNLAILTIYGNYHYVITALIGIINVGYNAILAGVGNSILLQTKAKLYDLFQELNFLLFLVIAFCTSCLLALYQPFMQLWMGSDYLLPMRTVILLAVYFYTWQIRVIGLNFKDAAGMWKDDWLKPYVGLILNITLNIILVQTLGLDGVLLATIAVMVVVYHPWEMIVLHRKLFQCSFRNYLCCMLEYGCKTALCAAGASFLVSRITLGGLTGFFVKVAVAAVFSLVALFLLCWRKKEMKQLLNRGQQIWRQM